MTDTIRVARTLAHGREAAQLAEDLPFLLKVREAFDTLVALTEGERPNITSKDGREMITDLLLALDNARHDSCLTTTVERAREASQLVGTVNIVRPK